MEPGEDSASLKEFIVVNDRAEQQLLQINLVPASLAHLRGLKLYSNGKVRSQLVHNQRLNQVARYLRPREQIEMLVN
jgi:hypothetical protein